MLTETTMGWFYYDLGASYNISAKPYVNMKVKAEQDMVIRCYLIDADGKGYQVVTGWRAI
jgi:hypothetical protein